MAVGTRWYRVDDDRGPLAYLRWAVHDPWFWLAVASFGVFLVSAYAEERGWVRFAGTASEAVSLGLALLAAVSSASRWQVRGIGRDVASVGRDVRTVGLEVRAVGSEVRGLGARVDAARSEARQDALRTQELLVQIRDRL